MKKIFIALILLLVIGVLLLFFPTPQNQQVDTQQAKEVIGEDTAEISNNTKTIQINSDGRPETYEQYSVDIDTYVEQLKELLLYRDPDPEPTLNQITVTLEQNLQQITHQGFCTLLANYTHGEKQGQIVITPFYHGDKSYYEEDIESYLHQIRGYLSKRDISRPEFSGPGGETIGMITSKEWSCTEAKLLEVLEKELDPFSQTEDLPIIREFLVVNYR